ncbi:DUF3987 domain-containing protein [Escherichia coli]
MIGKAIIKAQYNKQVPLTLVAMSVLTAMSIACQNQVDVCSPGNLRGAVNIYTMVLEKGKRPGKGISEIISGGIKNKKYE